MGAMILPGSRVLDVGAGSMKLRDHLPEGCSYTPVDVVARSPDTIVCDLNGPDMPRLPPADVAVLSGVLEYLQDVDALLLRLYDSTPRIVASYAVTRDSSFRDRLRRRSQGWVNDYSLDHLLSLFLHHGFHCEETATWYDQALFRFRRMEIQPALVRD